MSKVRQMFMNSTRSDTTQRLLATCGIVGPISYAIVVIILGFLQPGYNHITHRLSELGEASGQNAIVMNTAGVALLGILMVAFAFGLHRGIGEGKGSKIGPALLALSGAAWVMTGIFPRDPVWGDVSMVGITHSVFTIISAVAMILALLALSPRLNRDSLWRGYQYYSLATAIVAGVISAVYGFKVLEQWIGALQRVLMGVLLLWVEVMAIRLLRLS